MTALRRPVTCPRCWTVVASYQRPTYAVRAGGCQFCVEPPDEDLYCQDCGDLLIYPGQRRRQRCGFCYERIALEAGDD